MPSKTEEPELTTWESTWICASSQGIILPLCQIHSVFLSAIVGSPDGNYSMGVSTALEAKGRATVGCAIQIGRGAGRTGTGKYNVISVGPMRPPTPAKRDATGQGPTESIREGRGGGVGARPRENAPAARFGRSR